MPIILSETLQLMDVYCHQQANFGSSPLLLFIWLLERFDMLVRPKILIVDAVALFYSRRVQGFGHLALNERLEAWVDWFGGHGISAI